MFLFFGGFFWQFFGKVAKIHDQRLIILNFFANTVIIAGIQYSLFPNSYMTVIYALVVYLGERYASSEVGSSVAYMFPQLSQPNTL